jgi:hypothetical protein
MDERSEIAGSRKLGAALQTVGVFEGFFYPLIRQEMARRDPGK